MAVRKILIFTTIAMTVFFTIGHTANENSGLTPKQNPIRTPSRLDRPDLGLYYGLGAFAGLNVLPKIAAITQYSYRNPHNLVVKLLKKWNWVLKQNGYLKGRHINLDFHST